jgi:hypothetical protein
MEIIEFYFMVEGLGILFDRQRTSDAHSTVVNLDVELVEIS